MSFTVGNRVILTQSLSRPLQAGAKGIVTGISAGNFYQVLFYLAHDGTRISIPHPGVAEQYLALDAAAPMLHGAISADDHGNRLWEIAHTEAAPIGIGPHCVGLVTGLIDTGVANLEANGILDDPARVAEAENNLRAFVRAMKAEAERLNQNHLGENTFSWARAKLCPLFPFC